MNTRRISTLLSGVLATVLVVLLLGLFTFDLVDAARPQGLIISWDETWDSDRDLTTDVVVDNGATLTIKSGVKVNAAATDPVPYASGLSPKIEIIVKNGGTLMIESDATLTANHPGDWYGVVFLGGSDGDISGATISNGTVGVTIYDSSPGINQTTIQDLKGDDGTSQVTRGENAFGIIISGTSTTQLVSNHIINITGGSGVDGTKGADGLVGGGDGGWGDDGGVGGTVCGIYVRDGATPTIDGNTVSDITGGSGGDGGHGGAGGEGWDIQPEGGDGGHGGDAGIGGWALGISINDGVDVVTVKNNMIGPVTGGATGNGGDGGAGGNSLSGKAGGMGGMAVMLTQVLVHLKRLVSCFSPTLHYLRAIYLRVRLKVVMAAMAGMEGLVGLGAMEL